MKKILSALFALSFTFAFGQQAEKLTRHRYYYSIANVTNEQVLQQIVDEVNKYPTVQFCKYRIKPEKQMAEISFIYDEKPQKGEGEGKNAILPDLKKIILEKGLTYNGFNQTEETSIKQ